jgi:hypothetical protein
MLRRVFTGLVAISSLAALAPAQTVEELIARANQARGGVERLRAVQAVRMTGRMTMPSQANAPVTQITMEMKRPRRSRFEFKLQGLTGVQAYDGREAWGIPPVSGARAERLPEEMTGELVNQSDIEGPLVDHKAKGHKVALVGREKLDGKDVWRLRVTFKSGDEQDMLLDATSYLELRNERRRVVRGSRIEIELESRFGDYREVGGLRWPHTIEVGPKGRPEKQLVTFEKIEVDPVIDNARFRMPLR